jgi:hypothetical protein
MAAIITNNPDKPTAKDLATKAIRGVDIHFMGLTSLSLTGVSFTPDGLKALFQADIDATNTAEAGHTQWRQQVATQKATRAKTRAVRKALKNYLLGAYGADAVGVLEDSASARRSLRGVRRSRPRPKGSRRRRPRVKRVMRWASARRRSSRALSPASP